MSDLETDPGWSGAWVAPHPDLDWAESGAMALTGSPDGHPRLPVGPLAGCARGALLAFRALAPPEHLMRLDFDAPALLAERAAIFGYSRAGSISPGGSCRLLRCREDWVAVNLARPEDVSLVPAWLGIELSDASSEAVWRGVARRLRELDADAAVDRGRLLGLPVAMAGPPPGCAPAWFREAVGGSGRTPRLSSAPRVVDLSSLWAGPLCTHLLERAGCDVIKVESSNRPDGARRGPRHFFDLLNAGKRSVRLDLAANTGRRKLLDLVSTADIVVEGSRPRALAQLGIDAESLVRDTPGLTWLSVTGYGRDSPNCDWVAFGDDAAVAAGLALPPDAGEGGLVFCGDAIADPLAGLHGALAVLARWQSGRGGLLDLNLRDVARHCAAAAGAYPASRVDAVAGRWAVTAEGASAWVRDPRARAAENPARPLGADTDDVLAEWLTAC